MWCYPTAGIKSAQVKFFMICVASAKSNLEVEAGEISLEIGIHKGGFVNKSHFTSCCISVCVHLRAKGLLPTRITRRSHFPEQTWSACSYSNILSPFVLDFVIKGIWQRGHAGSDKTEELEKGMQAEDWKRKKKSLIRPRLQVQRVTCDRSYHFYTATCTCELLQSPICPFTLLHFLSKFLKSMLH